jgi:hypothetical protein
MSTIDIINVESVFAAFEMAELLGIDLGYGNDIDLPRAMRRVIAKTLEESIKFKFKRGNRGSRGNIIAPAPYDNFAELVQQIKASVITFNYDCCLDYALRNALVDYGFNNSSMGIKILKLHGSLNWAICRKCNNEVCTYDVGKFASNCSTVDLEDSDHLLFTVASSIESGSFKHDRCNTEATELIIVPPIWNKKQFHRPIQQVWHSAAAELAQAENIVVCGYSLPETDLFFRYLYGLGTIGTTRFKKFWVFDPDDPDKGTVKKRFEKLLGPGARGRFDYFPVDFWTAVRLLRVWHQSGEDAFRDKLKEPLVIPAR